MDRAYGLPNNDFLISQQELRGINDGTANFGYDSSDVGIYVFLLFVGIIVRLAVVNITIFYHVTSVNERI